MDITLTPQMIEWISEKVSKGLYSSSSEVISDAIRLLKRQEEQRSAMLKDLRQEILLGIKQLDTDKSAPFDSAQVSNIKTQGRTRAGI